MTIGYRDYIGLVEVEVDYNVGFVNGYAFFSSNEKDYKVKISDIVYISKAE